jgi:hypothetical protein
MLAYKLSLHSAKLKKKRNNEADTLRYYATEIKHKPGTKCVGTEI